MPGVPGRAVDRRPRGLGGSARGLSPSDLAMHVVLPELDGRIFAGVVGSSPGRTRSPICNFRILRIAPMTSASPPLPHRIAAWIGLRRSRRVTSASPSCCRPIPDATTRWRMRSDSMRRHPVEALLSDLAGCRLRCRRAWRARDSARCSETSAGSVDDYRADARQRSRRIADDLADAWGAPED